MADRQAGRPAYADAGVDVAAGERTVDLLRARIAASGVLGRDLLGGLGGFAAALELPPGMRSPVLVTATDGVGTKTEIARAMGRLDTIGQDLVAMCADDVVCHGARPWQLLDYIAVGKLDPERVASLVGGIADGCTVAGCVLVGGETAEHPGVMAPDAFDLAGFCVGVVERDRLLDGSAARSGDAVVGLASSGLHANGYSLVRAVIARHGLDLAEPLADALARFRLDTDPRLAGPAAADPAAADRWVGRCLGDALLAPTTIYAPHVLATLDALMVTGARVGGLAHITGGGLPGNLPRSVGAGLGVRVRPAAWPVPDVIGLLARLAGLDGPASRATFNAGIGFAIVVEPAAADATVALLRGRGLGAWVIGGVEPLADLGPERYAEAA